MFLHFPSHTSQISLLYAPYMPCCLLQETLHASFILHRNCLPCPPKLITSYHMSLLFEKSELQLFKTPKFLFYLLLCHPVHSMQKHLEYKQHPTYMVLLIVYFCYLNSLYLHILSFAWQVILRLESWWLMSYHAIMKLCNKNSNSWLLQPSAIVWCDLFCFLGLWFLLASTGTSCIWYIHAAKIPTYTYKRDHLFNCIFTKEMHSM